MKKNGYKTAVLAVDLMKNHTMEGGSNYYPTAGEMMPRVAESIDRMRDAGALIIYIWTKKNFSSGLTGAGPAVNPELAGRVMPVDEGERLELDDRLKVVKGRDIVLAKFAYSAFWGTPLLEILQQNGVENVLVCGIKTNVCCRATAVDAAGHCYKAFMLEDMTSTNDNETKKFHLDEINRYFAKVIDSKEAVKRLEENIF